MSRTVKFVPVKLDRRTGQRIPTHVARPVTRRRAAGKKPVVWAFDRSLGDAPNTPLASDVPSEQWVRANTKEN